jgi:hypothetical protein
MTKQEPMLWRCANEILYHDDAFLNSLAIRDAAIDAEPCDQFQIGQFIELLGYEHFLVLLGLPQQEFTEAWGEAVFDSAEEQAEMKTLAEEHCKRCKRCQLAAEKHRWIEEEIQKVMTSRRPEVDQMVQAEGVLELEPEGEHLYSSFPLF